MVFVVFVFGNASGHRGVMGNLLSEILIIRANKLISFSQDGIERLTGALISTLVLCDTKYADKHDPLDRVSFFISLVQHVLVLHNLGYFLHHRDWLVKVDGDTES